MPIELRTASTLSEAAGLLAGDRNARLLSGGTLIMRDINEGRLTDGLLVRITEPAYRQINASGGRIEIGAGVTMAEILKRRELAALHAPAMAVGGPAVRNMASVGGNLFAETPYGDFTVALLALDTQLMVMQGFGAARAVPLEEFLGARARGGQGLVTAVMVTPPHNAADLRFRKVSRVRPKGMAVLSVAAHLPLSGGRVAGARIALGAMASTPVRAKAVERALEGRPLDQATIAAARAVAAEGTRPATDAIASEWYRREVLPVHLARLLSGQG
ncbi:FAD binding domain-containing protein [Phreatobacter sp.]|uniref:FAD binding domain-containing protein n=1 Tax=Phreatobacter sp. TaxID=1966341 RepID=UPI003F6E67A3